MQKKIHFKGESNFESIFRACLPVLHECYGSYTSYAAMLDAYSLASHQDIYIFLVTSLHLHTPLGLFGFWIIHRATLIQCDFHLSCVTFMPHPSPLIFMCL